uniref:Xylanase inhibitor C-terminal domain-containing protein n=1 Tax=Setaria italica TaxID=4555 RepID=K3YMH7_SETIT
MYHYYFKAKGLAMNEEYVPLPDHELSVALSPRDRYASLRSDVYRALLHAYVQATPSSYSVEFGLVMTEIALMLDGERRLSMRLDDNFLVGVNMVCLEFVEMKQQVVALMDPGRRLCLAKMQLGVSSKKMQLGVSGLLWSATGCGNFNFTMGI